jgi:flagellar basal body P-ring formation protein FlgA
VAAVAAGIVTLPAAATWAATLRSTSVVTSNFVKLSDLFDDLDPGQDKVIGPAPAPGTSVQVGGRQLIAIADQYGIDWLDDSPSALATITRSGRILDKEFFSDFVQKYLSDDGTDPLSIDLSGFHPMMVAPDDPKPVTMSDVDWDQKTGRFSATIYRTHPTGDVTQDSFLLTGTVRAAQRLLVFSHSLPADVAISPSDVRMDETYTGHATTGTFTDEAAIDGMSLVHNVVAGAPVLDRDLHRTVVMHKGGPIMIAFTVPGIHLAATGRALEDGGFGQYVRALNLSSGMIVTGRVTGESEIEVDATSSAVPSNPSTLRLLTASARAGMRADSSFR